MVFEGFLGRTTSKNLNVNLLARMALGTKFLKKKKTVVDDDCKNSLLNSAPDTLKTLKPWRISIIAHCQWLRAAVYKEQAWMDLEIDPCGQAI